MTQRSTPSTFSLFPIRSPFLQIFATGLATAALIAGSSVAHAQSTDPATQAVPEATQSAPAAAQPASSTPTVPDAQGQLNLSTGKKSKKDEKVVQSKDTRQALKKEKKDKVNQLAGLDAKLPDKALYDKAEEAVKHGHYDVARLDLQTLLNTYQDSQYQMRAKLAIADSWYKEGGTAALTQAEQEYKDFITFFPNAPEAAEAQMRVGDIYFKQMDKPDRDYTKTKQAEQEYRLMLQQFPDSPLVPQARQRLREVQETLASREANVAEFYSGHNNLYATIARYQTVVDTYPLYSRMDEVLIGLGDAYEAQAKFYRAANMPEAAKARLVKLADGQAVAAYRKVVLEHSAAAHVEDARDRLAAMNLPIPTPTPDQAAASAALENSRGQYTLSKRATLLFLHQADTVPAASAGEPPLDDPKPTLAPTIMRKSADEYNAAMAPGGAPHEGTPLPASAPAGEGGAAAQPATPAAPLGLQDVPAAGSTTAAAPSVDSVQPATSSAPSGGGTSLGVEIVPSSGNGAAARPAGSAPPAFPGTPSDASQGDASPAATGTTQAAPAANTQAAPAANAAPASQSGVANPLAPVGPPNAAALPPVQKPDAAPDAINEAKPGAQPTVAQTAPANGKKQKPAYYKDTESSSKHKKKKGMGKLNPF
jgi:outer membrane protein assembly factor BamD